MTPIELTTTFKGKFKLRYGDGTGTDYHPERRKPVRDETGKVLVFASRKEAEDYCRQRFGALPVLGTHA